MFVSDNGWNFEYIHVWYLLQAVFIALFGHWKQDRWNHKCKNNSLQCKKHNCIGWRRCRDGTLCVAQHFYIIPIHCLYNFWRHIMPIFVILFQFVIVCLCQTKIYSCLIFTPGRIHSILIFAIYWDIKNKSNETINGKGGGEGEGGLTMLMSGA